MDNGFILIHRKLLEWEWYSSTNDTRLFIHCLLKANWKEGYYKGIKIQRGSFVAGRNILSSETGLTPQQIRTSLNHLKSTNNITIDTSHNFSIITINNYDKYQLSNQESNQWITNNQPIDNHYINKEIKEKKEINKENISKDIQKKYFESLKVNTIFNEFLELRKKLKAVNSERAINSLINKLNEYDEETQYQMIEQSIVNSWKGLFELKSKKNGYTFSDLLKESNYE